PAPVAMAVGSLVVGVLAYLAWKGTEAEEMALPGEPSRVALGRFAVKEGQFRVLVPLANPATVSRLIELAAAIAKERDGEIVALRVALIPDQLAPSAENFEVEKERAALEVAHAEAQKHGVPMTSLVRIGHNAARAILETARERQCDLIFMGWKGFTATGQKILGETTDDVVKHARRDIILAKLTEHDSLKSFLLPTAGGTHARRAEEYIGSIARSVGGSLTVCSVAPTDASAEKTAQLTDQLNQAKLRIAAKHKLDVSSQIISNASVVDGILAEAESHDVVVVGASRDKIYKHILFGTIPEDIAKRTSKPVILVRHYEPVKDLIGRVMEE
ncbi:universal stress protein, partial [Rhodothermus sp. AH-315-K08]|nr:universal stress protein [Rhodothermus sp. AH-315-K08]